MSSLGKSLKALREQSGWSQKMVADLANLGLATVSKVEADDCNFSSARQYAAALGRRLQIDASRRDRKVTAAKIAEMTRLSVNTVIRVMAICADPSRLDTDCHLASLNKYLSAVGGSVIVIVRR